jgi:hypothetical protein
LLVVAAFVAAAMTSPASSVAQAPTQDSVVGSLRERGYHAPFYDIDVRSGPSGENVTGTVTWGEGFFGPFTLDAVCLSVSGNRATVVATLQGGSDIGAVKVTVVDSPPGESDQSGSTFSVNPSVLPTCESPLAVAPVDGSVTVTDAQPSPTSKDQCMNGGWRNFPGFRNQGDCVSYVATRGKNPPAQP